MRLIQKTHYAEDDTATEQERYVAARELARVVSRSIPFGTCHIVAHYANDSHTVGANHRCEAPHPAPDELGESNVYTIRTGYEYVALRFRCLTCSGHFRITIPRSDATAAKNS